jgi:membrane protein DedA with SNARE-associated domain
MPADVIIRKVAVVAARRSAGYCVAIRKASPGGLKIPADATPPIHGRHNMTAKLLTALSALVLSIISGLGYGGVALLMAIESACIPLPSEVVMPFAGYLVSTGRFSLQAVAIAGTIGCLLGSYVAYFVGAIGGRQAFERYGHYVLISHHELAAADYFFERWGSLTVFVARMLPVVRTFIAFPAGLSRMNLWRFSIYTVLGSYPWCLALAYAGMKLGEHWDNLAPYFHRFDDLIGLLILAALAAFVYARLRGGRDTATSGTGVAGS